MTKVKVKHMTSGGGGFVLFMAWVGALIYFIERNEGFWGSVLAVLQACVWPAYVLYDVLKLLAI